MSGSNTPPEEINFNDPPSNSNQENGGSVSPTDETASIPPTGGDQVPKPKRIACIICRKRKLKCDGARPSCGTCSRLSHSCAYDEVRRKSGPKRGRVKELEAKLGLFLFPVRAWVRLPADRPVYADSLWAQLQADKNEQQRHPSAHRLSREMGYAPGDPNSTMGDSDMMTGFVDATQNAAAARSMPSLTVTSSDNNSGHLPWDLVGLGLEESLPPPDMVDEL